MLLSSFKILGLDSLTRDSKSGIQFVLVWFLWLDGFPNSNHSTMCTGYFLYFTSMNTFCVSLTCMPLTCHQHKYLLDITDMGAIYVSATLAVTRISLSLMVFLSTAIHQKSLSLARAPVRLSIHIYAKKQQQQKVLLYITS